MENAASAAFYPECMGQKNVINKPVYYPKGLYFCRWIPKKRIMLRNLIFCLPVATLLLGCDTKEKEQMKSKIDSLQVELETSQKMARTLNEVGVLMDSIDASRQLLRVNMVEGTTYEDYKERMNDINNFVRDSQKKIEDLEKSLSKSKANAGAFSKSIKQLKADLEKKTTDIAALQEQVDITGTKMRI